MAKAGVQHENVPRTYALYGRAREPGPCLRVERSGEGAGAIAACRRSSRLAVPLDRRACRERARPRADARRTRPDGRSRLHGEVLGVQRVDEEAAGPLLA